MGYKGVNISRTCFPNENKRLPIPQHSFSCHRKPTIIAIENDAHQNRKDFTHFLTIVRCFHKMYRAIKKWVLPKCSMYLFGKLHRLLCICLENYRLPSSCLENSIGSHVFIWRTPKTSIYLFGKLHRLPYIFSENSISFHVFVWKTPYTFNVFVWKTP